MHNYSEPAPAARKRRVGILGYAGYSGAELASLLERHPGVTPVLLSHRQADDSTADNRPVPCDDRKPQLPRRLPWSPAAIPENGLEAVFTATPPEVSMEVVPEVLAQGARAIDLSGAF